MTSTLPEKLQALRAQLTANAPLVVAYSGGVDSAYLLAEARRTLGPEGVLGIIADSASLPRQALADAVALAESVDARLEIVATRELEDPRYNSNPVNRCYFCKAELFSRLTETAQERGFQAIAYGENADDMRQVRPGRQAASEFSVLAPLRDAGLTKEEIRALSRELHLPTADAPAQPCLSSRIPHGTKVTATALAMIEQAEVGIRALGFQVFRVRHLEGEGRPPHARLQVAPAEMPKLSAMEAAVETAITQAGYAAVEIDPEGYR